MGPVRLFGELHQQGHGKLGSEYGFERSGLRAAELQLCGNGRSNQVADNDGDPRFWLVRAFRRGVGANIAAIDHSLALPGTTGAEILRLTDGVNVANFARTFSGGGHNVIS